MAETWSVKGTYFETCNCDAACPCVFLSPPTTGDCTVLIAWHIEQGRYGKVVLDGLNVAFAVHAPGHMMQTKWKVAAYLDSRASDAQKDALTQIFTGQAGGHPAAIAALVGQVVGAKSVPIEYRAEGKRRSLRIEGIANAEIEALGGAGGTEVTVSGHPLCVAPGFPATVAKSTQLTYRDHGWSWDITNKNGFFSPFAYQAG